MRNETTRARLTYQSIISPGRSTVSCSNYTKNAPILSLYQRTIPLEITGTCLCSTRVSRDFIDFICAAKKKTVLQANLSGRNWESGASQYKHVFSRDREKLVEKAWLIGKKFLSISCPPLVKDHARPASLPVFVYKSFTG